MGVPQWGAPAEGAIKPALSALSKRRDVEAKPSWDLQDAQQYGGEPKFSKGQVGPGDSAGPGPGFGGPDLDTGGPPNPYSGTADESSPSNSPWSSERGGRRPSSPWSADTSDSPPSWTGAGEYRHYGAPVTSDSGASPDGGRAEVRNQPGYTPETTSGFNPIRPQGKRGELTAYSGIAAEYRPGGSMWKPDQARTGGGGMTYGDMDSFWERQRGVDRAEQWAAETARLEQERSEWEAEREQERENKRRQDEYWRREHEEADRRSGGDRDTEDDPFDDKSYSY